MQGSRKDFRMKHFFVSPRKLLPRPKRRGERLAQAEDNRAQKCNRKFVSPHHVLHVGLYKGLQSHLNTNMTASSDIAISPTMDFKNIRKTIETPPRVSIIDLITVVSKVNNPREAWSGLQRAHPETVSQADSYRSDYKFPGRGNQTTPVINARGAIMIINLLPGAMAASFRAAWADIIVRYIAGDPTLAAEIEQNNRIQTELADDDPRRFCRQDVEARHISKSVISVQDIRSAQIYFGIAGPPEIWTDIRRSDGTLNTLKENEFLVKTGYLNLVDENTGRYGQHVSEYGFFRVSDNVLGFNPRLAEQKLKGWLRNENLLLSAKHVNKTTCQAISNLLP